MTRRRKALLALAPLLLACAACGRSARPAASGSAAVTSPTSTPAATSTAPDLASAGLVSSSVHAAVTPRSTTINASMVTPDGRTRTYHLYVPSTVAAGASGPKVPLVVALHGGAGSGTQFERNSGFDGLAEANDFIVVYPDGIGTGLTGTRLRTWNGGACCGRAVTDDVDDVTFIRLLIARLRSEYPIDPDRIYAVGHSNGGVLAYRLACELSDEIAAVGVQSTSLEIEDCDPSHPVALLHIHGTADQNIPINGGVGPQGISRVDFNPPIDGVETIAGADRCGSKPTVTAVSSPQLTIESWGHCADGTTVEFVKVAGASHAWMGHPGNVLELGGTPFMGLDSSLVIWTFLSHQVRQSS